MTNELSTKPVKDFKLDKLRVIAMLMVVVIHVANRYCNAFRSISLSEYVGAVTYNTISRVSVPIFFMISGMLLLRKPVDLKKNNKRILNKLIYLIIISAVYLIWDNLYNGKSSKFWPGILTHPDRKLLWFMYAIIGLYIALPFLRRMVENMTAKEDIMFVVIWIVLNGGIHLIRLGYDMQTAYRVPIFNGTYYLGYFVLGHIIGKHRDYIAQKLATLKAKLLTWLVIILSISVSVLITALKAIEVNKNYELLLQYKSIFIIISSIAFFIVVYFSGKNKENKFISHLASNSFEVYLFHGIALDFFMTTIPFVKINPYYGIPMLTLLIFAATYLGILIVKTPYKFIKSRLSKK